MIGFMLENSSGDSKPKPAKEVIDCRRSTAAQFFVEEEMVHDTVSADRVVRILKEASLSKKNKDILKNLQNVQNLIIHRQPKLLDNFLDEVISFQHDKNFEVRTFVVNFIEEACMHDMQILPKVISNLKILLDDKSTKVQKKVIQTTIKLYTHAIRWLSRASVVDEVMEATWGLMTHLKHSIFALIESDNEGIRAFVVKFMECVVVTQTYHDGYSQKDLSLDQIPLILNTFRPRKMEEEAKEIFQKIIDLHCATHVSSLNLMTCMQVLTTICRKRFEFFSKVLQAFESLHANLPPTLSQSQVTSVRKSLKLQLFILVKHPGAVKFHSQISIMLTDLGATNQQISKCFPTIESYKKRPIIVDSEGNWIKKVKLEEEAADAKGDSSCSNTGHSKKAKKTAIDITAHDVLKKFSTLNVVDLSLVSMLSLPEIMPTHFQSTYTPIANAGTEPQVRHLARLLATQLTIAGLGPGAETIKAEKLKQDLSKFGDGEDDEEDKPIHTIVGKTVESKPKKQPLVLIPSGGPPTRSNKFSKKLDFSSMVKPLTGDEANRMSRAAFNRIINSENIISKTGALPIRAKILTSLATEFRGDFATDLRNHILENPKSRIDLAFTWIYQEYSACRGFESSIEKPIEFYEETIDKLLKGILENEELKYTLFNRFYIDSPLISDGMAECLKKVCCDPQMTESGLQLAEEMITKRPTQQLLFLGIITDLTLHENVEIRSKAANLVVEIHKTLNLDYAVEAFALRCLKFLLKASPSRSDFVYFSRPALVWSEELVKLCLHLYLSLLPLNHQLIHDLGTVYVETSADIKRTILRALEAPVKGMSMASPELLLFVEKCPKGAETLVTRIIHILTDKAPPSVELVARVRDLYRKRVPDVRFLIPIINGLTKQEVESALPELIKLNPTVLKEVFHRLLGSNSSPLTPTDLLVALHNIEPTQCNLKMVIKATSLCFEEKNVYNHTILGLVMQQLMEQDPLPILLMRTVIQSLANYPQLSGLVNNILQRLIVKEVWKQKKIWEGFIKCCQRTKSGSSQILLQLPAPQLKEVLESCPDIREPLCKYVDTLTDHQKAHIPGDITIVLNSFKHLSSSLLLSKIDDSKDESYSILDFPSEVINVSAGEPLPPGIE
ncbi:symplekin [Caerostris darwini]|uniref:Symplekin n=1 Tax=Caerostris darwini TaxID=1538125 RepID=A0AAV4VRM4_9ARAC|nr:symplekin [Caerostris darwini]